MVPFLLHRLSLHWLSFLYSRICSWTLCAQRTSPYHMSPDRLLVRLHSRLTCFLTCTIMNCRLVYDYVSCLCLPLLTHWLVCRVVIPGSWLVYLLCLFVLVFVLLDIYVVGDEDSFLIFNLLCNHPTSVTCEIPHTLLVPSSSLAKATALRFLRSSSSLSTRLLVVKSSLRVYFGTLVTEDWRSTPALSSSYNSQDHSLTGTYPPPWLKNSLTPLSSPYGKSLCHQAQHPPNCWELMLSFSRSTPRVSYRNSSINKPHRITRYPLATPGPRPHAMRV